MHLSGLSAVNGGKWVAVLSKQVCKPPQISQITSPTKLQPSVLLSLALLTFDRAEPGPARSTQPRQPNRHRRYVDNQVLLFADRYLPFRQVISGLQGALSRSAVRAAFGKEQRHALPPVKEGAAGDIKGVKEGMKEQFDSLRKAQT